MGPNRQCILEYHPSESSWQTFSGVGEPGTRPGSDPAREQAGRVAWRRGAAEDRSGNPAELEPLEAQVAPQVRLGHSG